MLNTGASNVHFYIKLVVQKNNNSNLQQSLRSHFLAGPFCNFLSSLGPMSRLLSGGNLYQLGAASGLEIEIKYYTLLRSDLNHVNNGLVVFQITFSMLITHIKQNTTWSSNTLIFNLVQWQAPLTQFVSVTELLFIHSKLARVIKNVKLLQQCSYHFFSCCITVLNNVTYHRSLHATQLKSTTIQ